MNELQVERGAVGFVTWCVLVVLAAVCGLNPFDASSLAVISLLLLKVK